MLPGQVVAGPWKGDSQYRDFLHIYGQVEPGEDVVIVGTEPCLDQLFRALGKCLQTGECARECFSTSSGAQFRLAVEQITGGVPAGDHDRLGFYVPGGRCSNLSLTVAPGSIALLHTTVGRALANRYRSFGLFRDTTGGLFDVYVNVVMGSTAEYIFPPTNFD